MDLQIFKNHLLKYLSNDEINDLIESFDEEENHSLVINPKKINIDKLEKTKLKVKNFDKRYEAYQPFALAAIVSLLLEMLLRITLLRRIP